MIHPDTKIQFISDAVGYGVVATKFIPKGTITWVQDSLDRIFSPTEIENLTPEIKAYLDTYCFTNRFGNKVLCWDNGKYVNHSFNPSCFTTPYDFEIAIRDIFPGEELTDDYGYLNIERPFAAIDEGTNRKIVYPDDLVTYHEQWDLLLLDNLPSVFKVPQPLVKFMAKPIWKAFQAYEFYPERLPSLQESYYDPAKASQHKQQEHLNAKDYITH